MHYIARETEIKRGIIIVNGFEVRGPLQIWPSGRGLRALAVTRLTNFTTAIHRCRPVPLNFGRVREPTGLMNL